MLKQSPELLDPNELIRTEICPSCGAEIPRYRDHVVWCKSCNWNLSSPTGDKPQSRIEKLYERLGKRTSLRLHQQMMGLSEVKRTPSSSRILAFIAAALVHLITLLVLIGGVALLIMGFPNIVFMGIGVLLLLLAWLLRPQVGKMPSKFASREKFPTLYKIVDEIADTLNAPHVAGIVLTPDFNASFQQVGWKRSAIVRVGIPLFAILNQEQQAAVLAHELAHGVNGDPMRGLWVGSAVNSLFHWSYLIRPQRIWDISMGGILGILTALLMVIVNLCLLGISNLLWYLAIGFINLIYYDSQRAEYLADYLASSASGTTAMLSALERMYLGTSFDVLVQRFTLNNQNGNLLTEFRNFVRGLPETELERRRRISLREDARLDRTHPPTAYRVEFLQSHRIETPKYMISVSDAQQIERELMSVEPEIRSAVKSQYLSRLYH